MANVGTVFGLAGWSGSGKTTLIEKLLPALTGRGLRVSTLKHAHHDFQFDRPGKDSWRHREAGAAEVMVSSPRRWALVHEIREEVEPALADLLSRMSPVDLVLVEGFKRDPFPKLEVHRAALGKPLLAPDDRDIVAIASDAPLAGATVPRFNLDDVAAIASFIVDHCRLAPPPAKA
ncbi:MAG TPA: molybdopterin-guanine dinucleotide biosynthesis protein B [Stellaceae bacterium]|jgi:molybdopterin-guanine dinucleotide biosynthesis protein B|nr:molybdopterin-guanine dinucleotide biosynthesis protein B [Stellaceae bacterium]